MRSECRLCVLIWAVVGMVTLTWLLAPVLTPFIAGALLAYLGDPWADRLEALGLKRSLAVTAVFAVLFVLLTLMVLLLLPMVGRQLAVLAQRLPEYMQWLQENLVPLLRDALGISGGAIDLAALGQALSGYWAQAGGMLGGMLGLVSASGGVLVQFVANLLLIPVVTFYLLRDWDILITNIGRLLPRRIEPAVAALAAESDEVLGAFLRGQILVMLAQGAIYSLGLWIVGLEFGLLIGMLAGLVSFVPYLGAIVGVSVALIAAYLQFHEIGALLPVLLVFGVGQVLEGMLLTPLLVGDRIGLHPVAVIFAVLAGGQLFGFFGVLVALPVAAVVMVLLRHSHDGYLRSALYGSTGNTTTGQEPP